MSKYKFCDLIIEMDVKYDPLKKQANAYLYQGLDNSDIIIPPLDNIISNYQKRYNNLSIGECEYVIKGAYFYKELLKFGGILLHSSCVVKDNFAYLFSAPSGTGKSTHTSLWIKKFNDAKILNDDKPALIFKEGKLYACGTPFSGKTDLNLNEIYPVKGIAFLERSSDNWIKKMDNQKAIYSILNQTIRPDIEDSMDKAISIIEKIVGSTNIYSFGCNVTLDAVKVSYEAMSHED